MQKADGCALYIVKIDNGVHTDPVAAIKDPETTGISHIDTVIANAATGEVAESVLGTNPDDIRRHLEINTISALVLFQAFKPLLQNSKKTNAKFIAISSNLGSIELAPSILGPRYCYSVSKAALNYMIWRIHIENEWLTATALQPGWVQTDMGQFAARVVGMKSTPMKLEDSVAGCLKVIDDASRERHAGEFVGSEGKLVPW